MEANPENGWSKLDILKPNEVCTLTYLVIGSTDTYEEAKNFVTYMETKFARMIIKATLTKSSLIKDNFNLLPMQDFSQSWTDEMLYKKYGLVAEEINYIESHAKSYTQSI